MGLDEPSRDFRAHGPATMWMRAKSNRGAARGNTVASGMDPPVSATRARLSEVLGRSERDFELGRAALYVAQEEYPQLPVERYLLRLDALAESVKDRLDDETAPPVVLGEVIHTLFGGGRAFAGTGRPTRTPEIPSSTMSWIVGWESPSHSASFCSKSAGGSIFRSKV